MSLRWLWWIKIHLSLQPLSTVPSITQLESHKHISSFIQNSERDLSSVNQMLSFACQVQAGWETKPTPVQYVQALMITEGRT